jgi:toxin ParE1/3/4
MNLELSPLAQADVQEIIFTIASDRPTAARRWKARLDTTMEQLAEFPGIGTRRDDLHPGLRSFPVEPYLIFYHVEETVYVLRILHGARDIAFLLAPQDQPPETGSF